MIAEVLVMLSKTGSVYCKFIEMTDLANGRLFKKPLHHLSVVTTSSRRSQLCWDSHLSLASTFALVIRMKLRNPPSDSKTSHQARSRLSSFSNATSLKLEAYPPSQINCHSHRSLKITSASTPSFPLLIISCLSRTASDAASRPPGADACAYVHPAQPLHRRLHHHQSQRTSQNCRRPQSARQDPRSRTEMAEL